MQSLHKNVYRERVEFSKIKSTVPIPNLIEIQKKSYERFLQMYTPPAEREDVGLQSVFKSVFPISDFRENSSLEFIDYSIGNWDPCGWGDEARGLVHEIGGQRMALKLKYDINECQERGMTYAVPLKVTIRLVVWNKDPETGAKTIRDIKEQEVYFGDIPLMTDNGTFIINGTERVIVSQLHRSPGVFFHSEDKTLFIGQIIPYRGSWVEFEYDSKNLLYVRIDRKRKFLASVFLRALGLRGADDMLRAFYTVDKLHMGGGPTKWAVGESLIGLRAGREFPIPGTEITIHKGKKVTQTHIAALKKAGVPAIEIDEAELAGAHAAADVVDPKTGEVILEANEPIDARLMLQAQEKAVELIEVFFPEKDETGPVLSATLRKDPIRTHEEALIEIYRRLRPGDPPTLESSRSLFENMFFNPQKYDFSRVGRLKLNTKLKLTTPLDEKILHPQDFYEVIKYLLKLKRNPANVDDIDHLGNRRVRSVGELLENQFRIGLVRMERAIKEKMSVYQEMATAMPHDLINAKPVMAAIREFFGSSQLSQFMDQTNPLSEITHKRRLSALGPGGLSRERAGFEVRDVHPTHYGRICPIETPEGPNIGLISSLSCYARINEFGFIESPYREVKHGRIVDYVKVLKAPDGGKYQLGALVEADEVLDATGHPKRTMKGYEFEAHPFYLSAWEEDQYVIAQANVELDENLRLVTERVTAREAGNFKLAHREEIQYVDVSPKQLVSVAASLIPFLENDDANRALMGSNMQRQAVPLLQARAPFVGTGMEYITARDSGSVVVARRTGTVDYVDSQRIVVRVESESEDGGVEMGADIYNMTKFKRSNQNTCLNQRPIVRVGQKVAEGPGPGRRAVHRARRARARPQRAGRLHAVARLQLRGRDSRVREAGEGGLLHLDPHRGVRDRGARHQARTGRDHARHPERRRRLPAGSRRQRRHPHRRLRQAGRHPGRQGHAEGRDPADAGREAAPRHLRREGRRRPRRLARLPAGHRGHHRRRQDLLAQGHREGRARQVDRGGRPRDDGEESPGRDSHPPRRGEEAPGAHAARPDAAHRPVRRARPRAAAEEGHARSPTRCSIRCPTKRSSGCASPATIPVSTRICAWSRSAPSARSRPSARCSRRRRTRSAAATSCPRASSSWSRSTSR